MAETKRQELSDEELDVVSGGKVIFSNGNSTTETVKLKCAKCGVKTVTVGTKKCPTCGGALI